MRNSSLRSISQNRDADFQFQKLKSQGCYFADFFFLASARRSVFFRRFARFLALSLPLLCPISLNVRLFAAPQQSDETVAGVCVRLRRTAVDAILAWAHPELWSLADPALPPATWPLGRLLARVPRRVCS